MPMHYPAELRRSNCERTVTGEAVKNLMIELGIPEDLDFLLTSNTERCCFVQLNSPTSRRECSPSVCEDSVSSSLRAPLAIATNLRQWSPSGDQFWLNSSFVSAGALELN